VAFPTGHGRGGGSDGLDVAVGVLTVQARGGGTRAFERGVGEISSPDVAARDVTSTGGDIDGNGADDWARQSKGSNQGSVTVARMTANPPIRSIGRGSFPDTS
jgi:hypothetical protein